MSSPTERAQSSSKGRQTKAALAAQRAKRARLFSLIIAGAGLGLVGFFLVQAGFFASLWKSTPSPITPAQMPDQALGTGSEYAGFDNQNQPFAVSAAKSYQDKTTKSIVHMETVAANLKRATGVAISAAANSAEYDSKGKLLNLEGNVTIAEDNRFVAKMAGAKMDMQSKAFESSAPVQVTTENATVEADAMAVNEDGSRVKFTGRVKYRLNGETQ